MPSIVGHRAEAPCISVKDVVANDAVITKGVGMSGKLNMQQESKFLQK